MAALVPGQVYLVGAGPGATDLITVRGLKILQSAEVILYDALLSPELLAEARADALLIHVGKRGYCIGSTRQETIHEVLVAQAKLGRTVCRLKCGDPCVFGRGGEEALELVKCGIPFEIVPGVTSALGACAAAGIPLTHRDVGPMVALVTGHHDPDSENAPLDWSVLAKIPVVVFYMGVRHWKRILERLQAAGLPADTLVACIEAGSLPEQVVIIGTASEIEWTPRMAPAILVVGAVVNYREQLSPWLRTSELNVEEVLV